MPEAHYSVTIQRPIGAVFEYVADGEKGSEWRPGVLDITRVSGSGVGTTYRQGVKGPMGRRIAPTTGSHRSSRIACSSFRPSPDRFAPVAVTNSNPSTAPHA